MVQLLAAAPILGIYMDEYDRLGYDLTAALNENSCGMRPAEVKEILLELTGENDWRNWHWIVELEKEAGFAYITGGCDYTGWDCQSHCEVFRAASIEEAISLSSNDARISFEGLLRTGAKITEAPDTVW